MPIVILWNGIELDVVKYTKIDQRDQFFVTSYQFYWHSCCRDKHCGIAIVYYPTIYILCNCLFFAMSWVTELFHRSINMTIDWHFTMAWLPASLLKIHRHLSTCATTMRVRFVYERRRYATMVKIRHGLATLNSNNSIVYGQKHKVWVLVFLVRTSGTFWDPKFSRLGEIFCFATKPHHLQQLHARKAAKYYIKWVG